jgi:hypothetical protein
MLPRQIFFARFKRLRHCSIACAAAQRDFPEVDIPDLTKAQDSVRTIAAWLKSGSVAHKGAVQGR